MQLVVEASKVLGRAARSRRKTAHLSMSRLSQWVVTLLLSSAVMWMVFLWVLK